MVTSEHNTQVKSKERVQKHGEVFTPKWVVDDMLNLLPVDVWKSNKTFLEPACGEGAFLVEIYRRKLDHIKAKNQDEWEWQSAIATSLIYGIELLEDNVKHCKKNLVKIFKDFYHKKYPETHDKEFIKTIAFLISQNIICGNALTYRECKPTCGNKCVKCDEIVFSEWTPLENKQFKRKDYTYEGIINTGKKRQRSIGGLFETEFSNEEYGLIKAYNPINYKEIRYAKS